MNSLITFRWYQGGLKVFSPTSQRGGNMTKSTFATPCASDGAVSTVKMEGSGWSKLTVPITMKLARSYRYGVRLPCQATTSNGEWSVSAAHKCPPNLPI